MNALEFVRARLADEQDEALATHMASILWQMCELAASIDAEWGCSHEATNLFHNRELDEWDGPVTSPLPIDCPGAERLAKAAAPLARVWPTHPDFRREWGPACDRCGVIGFDVVPHTGTDFSRFQPCPCDPVPLCGRCAEAHRREWDEELAYFRTREAAERREQTERLLGSAEPGAAPARFTFTTTEASDALRKGGA